MHGKLCNGGYVRMMADLYRQLAVDPSSYAPSDVPSDAGTGIHSPSEAYLG